MVSASGELSVENKSEAKKKKTVLAVMSELGAAPGMEPSFEMLSRPSTETLTWVCQKGIPGPRPQDRFRQSL